MRGAHPHSTAARRRRPPARLCRGWRRSCIVPAIPIGTGARGRKLSPAPGPVTPGLPFLETPGLLPAP
eukprot:1137699-Alexandrium_andersonii.AAC.1